MIERENPGERAILSADQRRNLACAKAAYALPNRLSGNVKRKVCTAEKS